jgi:hypothetical protein
MNYLDGKTNTPTNENDPLPFVQSSEAEQRVVGKINPPSRFLKETFECEIPSTIF